MGCGMVNAYTVPMLLTVEARNLVCARAEAEVAGWAMTCSYRRSNSSYTTDSYTRLVVGGEPRKENEIIELPPYNKEVLVAAYGEELAINILNYHS